MWTTLLDAPAEQQRADARALLTDLRDALIRFSALPGDTDTLGASIRQLDELFLLVVVGEFNAGKSAFINALVGDSVLEEGVTPTTARIHLIRYGDTVMRELTPDGLAVISAPLELLRDIHIVDTPGTNAILREHERLTSDFVPRSDLVLFVTSADRPFTESERAFLEQIKGWGKKIVLVVNKVDIFESEAELAEVMTFVRDAARRLLDIAPDVFPVSARLALRAKRSATLRDGGGASSSASAWESSRFEPLEAYVRNTLDDRGRFELKLLNPLGVGDALANRYLGIAEDRLALLRADLALLEDLERQLAVHREDLFRGFELRMTGIEKVLLEMESRGQAYFEDTLRIGRVFDLMNRARIEKEFEEKVVGDGPQQVERRVSDLVDWMVDQDFRQWEAVTRRVVSRERELQSREGAGQDIGSFHADRGRLIDSIGREARRVVETYDTRQESRALAEGARSSVAAAAAVGAGAVGLGAVVTAAATTVAADVTGLVMASMLAVIGFLIIPTKRRRARAELREKVADLRQRLVAALRGEFDQARLRSGDRIANAIAPYSRFVRAEQARWDDAQRTLAGFRARISSLRERVTGGRA